MYITTFKGIHFTPLEPKSEDIYIEDIAHAQSLMTRANGHFPQFYSVGQHSLACVAEAQARGYDSRVQLACLLHDGSEAYLSDITRPVKSVLEEYTQIEKRLQDAIYMRFLGSVPTEKEMRQIQEVDDGCLYYEFEHYMGEKLQEQPPVCYGKQSFAPQSFAEVEKAFLETYARLSKETDAGTDK